MAKFSNKNVIKKNTAIIPKYFHKRLVSILSAPLFKNSVSTIFAKAINGIRLEIDAKTFKIIDFLILFIFPNVIFLIIHSHSLLYPFAKYLSSYKYQRVAYIFHLQGLNLHVYLFLQFFHQILLKFDLHSLWYLTYEQS